MGAFGSKAAAVTESSTNCFKDITLWKTDISPACRAVMMAIDALNISIHEVDLNMDKGDHKTPAMMTLNHLQTLPVLKDQELVLYDSHAINSYLVSRYAFANKLLPSEPGGRAINDQILHYNSSILYPRFKAAAYPVLYEKYPVIMPQQVRDIEAAYMDVESMLVGRQWLGGSWPTLADISVAASISTLNVLVRIDDTIYPRVYSWLYRMSKQPYYITANKMGLEAFAKRIDCGYSTEHDIKCPRSSLRRRYVKEQNEKKYDS